MNKKRGCVFPWSENTKQQNDTEEREAESSHPPLPQKSQNLYN